jgi:predicted transcriptional regulator
VYEYLYLKEEETSTPQDELGDLPPDKDENIETATDRIKVKAEKLLNKLRNQQLSVDDHVRVSTSALHTKYQKSEKARLSKNW